MEQNLWTTNYIFNIKRKKLKNFSEQQNNKFYNKIYPKRLTMFLDLKVLQLSSFTDLST